MEATQADMAGGVGGTNDPAACHGRQPLKYDEFTEEMRSHSSEGVAAMRSQSSEGVAAMRSQSNEGVAAMRS